jgi:hypothetical protein
LTTTERTSDLNDAVPDDLPPLERLRAPFPAGVVGQLPKPLRKESPKSNCDECGTYHGMPAIHLDYVGHAAVTDRLLTVDPHWTWEPMAVDEQGFPALDQWGNLWIRLTVAGVTRIGVGDGSSMKERIGDALRNAAMRFGVALSLWTRDELESGNEEEKAVGKGRRGSGSRSARPSGPDASGAPEADRASTETTTRPRSRASSRPHADRPDPGSPEAARGAQDGSGAEPTSEGPTGPMKTKIRLMVRDLAGITDNDEMHEYVAALLSPTFAKYEADGSLASLDDLTKGEAHKAIDLLIARQEEASRP